MDAALGLRSRHALVFAAPRGFANEFYALAVDAYVRDAGRHGRPCTAPLGVHVDWLAEDGAIRRALMLDGERDRLITADWERPFAPDCVQFVCLGAREQTLHRELSARFRCPQVNPYPASAVADDKAATLARWRGRGLATPASLRVEAGATAAARSFAEDFPEVVVKPNGATEGEGVVYLALRQPGAVRRLESGQDLENPLDNWLLKRSADGFFALKETV